MIRLNCYKLRIKIHLTNIVTMNILNIEYFDIKGMGVYARKARLSAGLSQKQVAELIGSSQPNVSAAEKGENTRYIFVAIKIIKQIGKKEVKGPFYKISVDNNE